MAWSSPASWQYNGHDIITEEYLNTPGEATTSTADGADWASDSDYSALVAHAGGEAVASHILGSISADLSGLTEGILAADKAAQQMGLTIEQLGSVLSIMASGVAVPPKFVNHPPPADAKEWTCAHGFDALFCTLCDDQRKHAGWEAAKAAVRGQLAPTPLPRRRAMTLTGDVPA